MFKAHVGYMKVTGLVIETMCDPVSVYKEGGNDECIEGRKREIYFLIFLIHYFIHIINVTTS